MIKRIDRYAAIILALFVLGAVVWYDGMQVLSVLLGGLLSFVNFHWMAAGVDRLLSREQSGSAALVGVKFIGRLILILGAFFVMIRTSFLSPLGALVGLSAYPLAALVEGIRSLKSNGRA